MSIDYDRLRELRDKSTPSPWKFHEEQEWEHVAGPEYPPMLTYVEHTVEGSDGEQLFGQFNSTVLEERPGNLRLAALAPDMARELLRQRDGIEVIRDRCANLARSARAAGIHTLANEMYATAKALTDLLNGDVQ